MFFVFLITGLCIMGSEGHSGAEEIQLVLVVAMKDWDTAFTSCLVFEDH